VTVKATSKPDFAVMNLRAITLTPVARSNCSGSHVYCNVAETKPAFMFVIPRDEETRKGRLFTGFPVC
jgi:hypothetical protein